MTEIEAALSMDEPEAGPADEGDDLELELDLDLEPTTADVAGEETVVTDLQDEEIDLADIEKMLETGEGLELATPGAVAPEAMPTLDLEAEATPAAHEDMVATSELDGEETVLLDDLPDDDAGDAEIAAYAETYELGAVPERLGEEEPEAAAEAAEAPAKAKKAKKAKPAKGGVSKLLVLLLVLLLLGGGVYGAHFMGIHIPFVSDLLGPQVEDELGKLKISTFGIKSRFVENTSAGRLFVITGKVRNDYETPRSFISVVGKLYGKGKKLVDTRSVYCGNLLADLNLAKLPLAEINKQLNTKAGAKKSNLNVAPSAVVPFMVVFANLTPDLEEFTIEVAGSQ